MLILSLAALASLLSLSAYLHWLQWKTGQNLIRTHNERERELLDRLMFTTGNRGYVEATRQRIEEPKEEEVREDIVEY